MSAGLPQSLPSRLINIAVPVSFLHRDIAIDGLALARNIAVVGFEEAAAAAAAGTAFEFAAAEEQDSLD